MRTTLFGLLLVASTASAQQPSLPSRLTDAEFRSLIVELSEPAGIFINLGNNFTSNEPGFAEAVARLAGSGVRGGAYIGVGPEQNFSYIAGIRPSIAFIVDIRRQASVQHLMYKALFELSADRAELISLLFARPRPPGLGEATTIDALWERYWFVAADTALARRTVVRIEDRLRARGIALDSIDTAMLRYVYTSFVGIGPQIRDEPPPSAAMEWGFRLAEALSPGVAATTVEVRDATTGALLPGTTVHYSASSNAFGDRLAPTDSTGRTVIPPHRSGTPITIEVARRGYDTLRAMPLVIERRQAPVVVELRRAANCAPPPAAPLICVFLPGAARPATVFGGRGAVPAGTVPLRDLPGYAGFANFASLTAGVDSAGVPRSFLGTEQSFRVVKDLHERNLIVPLVGNFGGPKTIRSIGDFLRQRGTTVSAFYVSNVIGYLYTGGVSATFFQSAASLPANAASVIILGDATGTAQSRGRLCSMREFLTAAAPMRLSDAALQGICRL